MAIILYKPGNMQKIRGIPCQFQICNEFSYKHLLDQGWFHTPEECYVVEEQVEEVPEDITEEAVEVDTEEVQEVAENEESEETVEETAEVSDNGIRVKAKAAGIRSWHNKSITRLVGELKELEDAE